MKPSDYQHRIKAYKQHDRMLGFTGIALMLLMLVLLLIFLTKQ